MWTETTTINPEAWSEDVERTLLDGRDDAGSLAAVESARTQLAAAVGPQHVTLFDDGTATLVPMTIPTAEEIAAHEHGHELARLAAIDGRRVVDAQTQRERDRAQATFDYEVAREQREREWNDAEEANFGAALRAVAGGTQ